MFQEVLNKKKFKKINQQNWNINANFVINYGYPHIGLVKFLENKLVKINEEHGNYSSLIDIGCGSGWLKSITPLSIKYTGIDNCKTLIAELSKEDPYNYKFLDVEKHLPSEKLDSLKGDIIICCLSLIEIPFLNRAFENIKKLLNKNGTLIIISLDPINEIYRASKDVSEFNRNISIYRKSESLVSISKKISFRKLTSERNYHRILYSFSDYIENSKRIGLCIENIELFNLRNNINTPIYQYMEFRNQFS